MIKYLQTTLLLTLSITVHGQFIHEVVDKLRKHSIQEKIYIHTDKAAYVAGEDIYFTAYLVDATFHSSVHHPLRNVHTGGLASKIVYVELYGRSLLGRIILHSEDGVFPGDFHLSDTLTSGTYTIRAYTNFQRNHNHELLFSREIEIRSGKIKGIPVTEEQAIDLQFFPEGGHLLTHVENKVAFKAIDQTGTPVNVEGWIMDDTDKIVTSFATLHDGMGVTKFTPDHRKTYRAGIKNDPTKIYYLPEVQKEGYLIRVTHENKFIKVVAYSTAPGNVSLLAHTRGVVAFAGTGDIEHNSFTNYIPKTDFLSGVSHIVLFDSAGIPRCERLVFINHSDFLSMEVRPNQKTLKKRRKITLSIDAKSADAPASGNFSLSVYEDGVGSAERYPGNIVNNLLLTSDLRGTIHNPGYYMDNHPTTIRDTDLLMLTHGWRRFDWSDLSADPVLKFTPEEGLIISGRVMRTKKKPAAGISLMVLSKRGVLPLETDDAGNFFTTELFYDTTDVLIQTNNLKNRQTDFIVNVDKQTFLPSPAFNPHKTPVHVFLQDYYLNVQKHNKLADSYEIEKGTILLNEVEVREKKWDPHQSSRIHSAGVRSIKAKDLPPAPSDVLDAIKGRFAGVEIMMHIPNRFDSPEQAMDKYDVSIRGGGNPLFLMNGNPVGQWVLTTLPFSQIESVEVLKGPETAFYGSKGGNGVINVVLKSPEEWLADYKPTGMNLLRLAGIYRPREFYTPAYDTPVDAHTLPDIRPTLYWNPKVKTDADGKAKVSFYTCDVAAKYSVEVEGITADGKPGVCHTTFEVEP